LYTFKPIGFAIFLRDDLLGLLKAIEAGSYPLPNANLAGLCREAEERKQPAVRITNSMIYHLEGEFPVTFEEKQLHLLRLLYETGGREHKKRNISTYDDFPLAFAKDVKELVEIVDSLIDEGWLTCANSDEDPNMWPGGLRTDYYGLLPTREGKNRAKALLSEPFTSPVSPVVVNAEPLALTHLHLTVQKVAGSLFTSNHYPQAIQSACTALERAIQQKGGQSASITGTVLISKVLPKENPLISLSADQGEREGYSFLYRGLLQAIRNHYAHNLTEIPAARALEWLSFISALFYKLDEALPAAAPPAP
jgi:uncharacterized protein (TIGR02391 family)